MVRTLFQRRLQAYAAFLGVSVQDLVRARRAYMSLDGHSYSLDGDPPYSDDFLSLGRRVSYDLYRDREITIYG